jgi:hypothetical protein
MKVLLTLVLIYSSHTESIDVENFTTEARCDLTGKAMMRDPFIRKTGRFEYLKTKQYRCTKN